MPAKYNESQFIEKFWARVDIKGPNDCWVWKGGKIPDGYGCVRYRLKATGTHRVSWMLTNGDIPPNMYVLHKCDNRPCCNPSHLFLGTNQDNIRDKVEKGRCASIKGMNQSQSKLTDDDVRAIRAKYMRRKYGAPRLSKEFGVARSMITRILHGKNWSHVE